MTNVTFPCFNGLPFFIPAQTVLANYLPKELGDNGPNDKVGLASLPQALPPSASMFEARNGAFIGRFKRANATTVTAVDARNYQAELSLQTKPKNVDESTEHVAATIEIKNALGIEDCVIMLDVGLVRRPGSGLH